MTTDTDVQPTILEQANELIYGARAAAYGPFEHNARRLAELWNAYLEDRELGSAGQLRRIEPEDVAALLILLKLARLSTSNTHFDSWRDVAGYAGCAAKLPSVTDPEDTP